MELDVDHQRFREDAGYRGEVLLEGLKHMCPSPSVLVEVSQLLAEKGVISTAGVESWGEGLIEEGDREEAELLRGTSGLSGLLVDEEEEEEDDEEEERDDALHMEVFNSAAVKNIGRLDCEFLRHERLGRGGFGAAYRVTHLVDDRQYCIKEICLEPKRFGGDVRRMVSFARGILREVTVLSRCEHHPNVVSYNNAWAEVVTENARGRRNKAGGGGAGGGDGGAEDDEDDDDEDDDEDDEEGSWEGGDGASRSQGGGEASHAGSGGGEPSELGAREDPGGKPVSPAGALGGDGCSNPRDGDGGVAAGAGHGREGVGDDERFTQRTVGGAVQVLLGVIKKRDKMVQAKVKRTKGSIEAEAMGRDLAVYIQMELCSRSSLASLLAPGAGWVVDEATNLSIAEGLLRGLRHIHSLGMCHRDLKPQNVFISLSSGGGGGGVVKIGDFGLAKSFVAGGGVAAQGKEGGGGGEGGGSGGEKGGGSGGGKGVKAGGRHTVGVGTVLYASPEQLSGEACGPEADMFSLGIIACELFCSFASGMDRVITLSAVREGKIPDSVASNHAAVSEVASLCLSRDPKQRPTAQDALMALSPLVEQATLPPLLRLADRTIADLRGQLAAKDEELRRLRGVVAEQEKQIEALRGGGE